MGHLLFLVITCLNFRTAKLSSMVVSVSVVWRSSSRISAMISPLFRIRFCCSFLSSTVASVFMFRESSLIFEKVSMIASVALTACGLLRMVASMYRPFSGKAVGSLTFPPFIEVENFDFNPSHSVLSSSMMYPEGNLSGLFFTASLIRFVMGDVGNKCNLYYFLPYLPTHVKVLSALIRLFRKA